MRWRRIDLKNDLDPTLVEKAETAAAKHTRPPVPSLHFTEKRVEWVVLYDLARLGQITPEDLRWMQRDDLQYLAGMSYPHPDLLESPEGRAQLSKLLANAARAQAVLQQRSTRWTAAIAAIGGGVVGALATALAAHLWR